MSGPPSQWQLWNKLATLQQMHFDMLIEGAKCKTQPPHIVLKESKLGDIGQITKLLRLNRDDKSQAAYACDAWRSYLLRACSQKLAHLHNSDAVFLHQNYSERSKAALLFLTVDCNCCPLNIWLQMNIRQLRTANSQIEYKSDSKNYSIHIWSLEYFHTSSTYF